MSGCHIMTDVNAYRCVAIVVFLTEKPLYAIEAYYLKTGMPKLENVLLQLLQSLYSYVCVFFLLLEMELDKMTLYHHRCLDGM